VSTVTDPYGLQISERFCAVTTISSKAAIDESAEICAWAAKESACSIAASRSAVN